MSLLLCITGRIFTDPSLSAPQLSDILLYHFTDPSLVTSPIAPEQLVRCAVAGM